MSFDPHILEELLVCPKTRSPLVRDGETFVSVDPDGRMCYEIRDGIPNMLIQDARQLSVDEWSRIMVTHGRDAQTGARSHASPE